MNAFIDEHRSAHGVEPICRALQIAPSGYWLHAARKVWRALSREGVAVARCTVERLMRRRGLRGVIRGKVVRTTVSNPAAPCPLDLVNRQFKAERPNPLWVSDFT